MSWVRCLFYDNNKTELSKTEGGSARKGNHPAPFLASPGGQSLTESTQYWYISLFYSFFPIVLILFRHNFNSSHGCKVNKTYSSPVFVTKDLENHGASPCLSLPGFAHYWLETQWDFKISFMLLKLSLWYIDKLECIELRQLFTIKSRDLGQELIFFKNQC